MARVRSVSVSIDAPPREAPQPTRGPDGRSIAIPLALCYLLLP